MSGVNQWDAEWEVSVELASKLIRRQFPQLASKNVEILGNGWDNTVFLVGEECIFRFPRREVSKKLIQLEGKILPMLEGYFSIPYPIPLFYGESDKEYPSPFLGYPFLTGKTPVDISDYKRSQSAVILAQFLKGLHAFPVDIAREHGVQLDQRNLLDIASRKEKLLKTIYDMAPHFTKDEYKEISTYLQQLKRESVRPKSVLLHGDLHFKNILVDDSEKISGIIDWGDINIGHPGCDLSVVYSFLPPEARVTFFEVYGDIDEETRELARLIAVYIPFMILMQAIDEKDERIIKEAKATIKRSLAD